MKVTLIDFTGKGANPNGSSPAHYAAALLVFTKGTRLKMSAGGLEEQLARPHDDLLKELEYMANTIPSSWEFVDYTFMIEGVTRAFTHQLVRTRTASFAQQTMRVLNVEGWEYGIGPTIEINPSLEADYCNIMRAIDENYKDFIERGAAIEDARGILPTNILTNIVMKINMRNWVDMVRKRSSSRTQDEYRDVLDAMKEQVKSIHPWIDLFIDRTADRAIADLEYIFNRSLSGEEKTNAVKLLDQLRALS